MTATATSDRMGSGVLVLGYGNPVRGDDGLGPLFVERLEQLALPGVETRMDYQLCVEDALDIGAFERVLFVDASLDVAPPYHYYPLAEKLTPTSLDTHHLSPEALIHLARTLFGATTRASVLAIRGYEFEPFVERLSGGALANLESALEECVRWLAEVGHKAATEL